MKHAQSLDGQAAAATLLNQVISYKLDGDGKLSYAEILNPVTDLQNKTYNSSQQIFGKTSGIAFGITNDVTRSICLPEDTGDEPDENDLTVYNGTAE